MQLKTLFIDVSYFFKLHESYDEIEGVDWQAGHNLDASNDVLYGDFFILPKRPAY